MKVSICYEALLATYNVRTPIQSLIKKNRKTKCAHTYGHFDYVSKESKEFQFSCVRKETVDNDIF